MERGVARTVTEQESTQDRSGQARVLIIGGPDVDSRLDLMDRLSTDFSLACAGSDPRLEATFNARGFRFHAFHMRGAVSPLSDMRSFVELWRICRRESPDIVHAFATKPSVWGRLAAVLAGVPVVVGTLPGLGSLYVAGERRGGVVRRMYQWLQFRTSRSSSATVFQNEADRQQLIDAGVVDAEASTIIPGSGVRTDVFSRVAIPPDEVEAARREIGGDGASVVVTMVARLIRPKGVLEFARACRELRQTHPTARFVLIGPATTESVDALTSEEMAEVTECLTWLGSRTDVPVLLAASDIFVLPSYYREGMPRVLLEAGSMGLPLIAADIPGANDVVEQGVNGWLVPPREVEPLRRAIAKLVDDTQLRTEMGSAAQSIIRERFGVDAIAQQHAELYRELCRIAADRSQGRTVEP